MCAQKQTAHSMVSRSPLFMLSEPLTHNRYSPAAASATPIQVVARDFLPSNSDATGTSTTYSAVMKPALPAVVYTRPNCCSVLPAHRQTPHSSPPRSSVRFSVGLSSLGRFFSRSQITGSSTAAESSDLTPLNVNGCTMSVPTRCATNADPQIIAVSSSRRFPRIAFLFISRNPLSLRRVCSYPATFPAPFQASFCQAAVNPYSSPSIRTLRKSLGSMPV